MPRALLLSVAILTATVAAALAADVKGEWTRDDGKTKVRFGACGGDAVCGSITWLKDRSGPAKIGQQVFFDMKPNGENVWAGTAFNPDDGKQYSGKMTLDGDRLVTAGCVLGGSSASRSAGRARARSASRRQRRARTLRVHAGAWQTASILFPSGSKAKAP